MTMITRVLLVGLLCSIGSAQTRPENKNTGCTTASDINYQATYIYASSDTQNLGFYTQSSGCDSGSFARVHVQSPGGTDIECGYVALNGQLQLVQCPTINRGTMAEGQWTVYWETVPSAGQYSFNQFSVSHSQQTQTASTPTSVVTSTPTNTATQTSFSTLTDTFTSYQETVTSPSSTFTNTVLVTPSSASVTTTSTRTFTCTKVQWTKTVKTTSFPTPCRANPLTPCKKGRGRGRKVNTRNQDTTSHLVARDDNVNGMAGAPATVTVTPAAVISTSTAAALTSTVTVTSQATPNASTTVVNPTPTTTVYVGSAVTDTTSTLPQQTITITVNTSTVTTTTQVRTVTFTRVTPFKGPCQARPTTRAT